MLYKRKKETELTKVGVVRGERSSWEKIACNHEAGGSKEEKLGALFET